MTITKSNHLKAIAALMMLCIHLFNREHAGLFEPLLFVGSKALTYYISLFCDAALPIFAFVSGYGLYYKYQNDSKNYKQSNGFRIMKLYINYWIILVVFALILGPLINPGKYPGSMLAVVLNGLALDNSYNGAWWFFLIYILFVVTSTCWFRLFKVVNPILFIVSLLVIYSIAFYFRIYKANSFEYDILNYFQRQTTLFFTTLFQFMLGAFYLEFGWHQKLQTYFSGLHFRNAWIILGMLGLIVVHGIIPNSFMAPFTGLGFTLLFLQLDLPKPLSFMLSWLSQHVVNIWLIHLFFVNTWLYSFKEPILIYGILLLLCLVSSFFINKLYYFLLAKL